MVEKNLHLGKAVVGRNLQRLLPQLLGHRPLWDFWKILPRHTYYGTIEIHITDSKSSWNTGMPFVSSVSMPLTMPEDIFFACFFAEDTNYMHVLCSARIYSHLANTHKAGKQISTKFDLTKFYLLQDFQEIVLLIWWQTFVYHFPREVELWSWNFGSMT